MNTKEAIIDYTLQGLTPQLIQEKMPSVSLGYIYKVRSNLKKNNPNALQTNLQKKICTMRCRFSAQEIAEKLGCSIQYVYKVCREQGSRGASIINIYKGQDEYYTPLYAIKPIEKYLKRHSVIWCPFDKDESLFVRYFKMQGHIVFNTHIDYGQDFFETKPPQKCDYIISNPPFSMKTKVFKRLVEFGVPFAMLVSTDRIFATKERFELFKDGVEQLAFSGRIDYLTDYDQTEIIGAAPFESGYICKGVLTDRLVFEEIDKRDINL